MGRVRNKSRLSGKPQQRSSPRGELSGKCDADGTRNVASRGGLRAADLGCRSAVFYQPFQLCWSERRKFWQLIHRGSAAAVDFGVLGKIFGPGWKVVGQ